MSPGLTQVMSFYAAEPKINDPDIRSQRRLRQFALASGGFYAALWGLSAIFPGNDPLGFALLIVAMSLGAHVVRPGWNLTPTLRRGHARRLIGLFALLVVGATAAAVFLAKSGVRHPYQGMQIDLIAIMPPLLALTAIEEAIFRQIGYRWLEQGNATPRTVALATAIAWAGGHLHGVLQTEYALFTLLQSVYLVGIGAILAEIRRVGAAWTLSWAGHFIYNIVTMRMLAQFASP